MKAKKKIVTRRTVRRGRPKKSWKRFYVYMAICILVVLIAQIRLPSMLDKAAEPGTIKDVKGSEAPTIQQSTSRPLEIGDIPEYTGAIVIDINGGDPGFTEGDTEILSTAGYEYYSALDELGRCGYCEACVGPETQPEGEDRGEIWEVHPSGWRSGQGWERCHLIAWALTGENANDHNLVTGTHSMNVDGMLPYEIKVAEAADQGKHIMYRVTPIYKGVELVPRGVHMMAKTVEDGSVSFNIFVYNVEDGKIIDYMTGYVR